MTLARKLRAIVKNLAIQILRLTTPRFRMLSPEWNVEALTLEGKQTFCGYYDLSPFSETENELLVHVAQNHSHPKLDTITLGLYDLASATLTPLCKTTSWGWQIGARLGWLSREQRLIIANTNDKNGSNSTIWQISSGNVTIHKELSLPLFAWSYEAGLGSNLNFRRLEHFRPGYGFENGGVENCHLKAPSDDGVFVVDMKTNTSELIVSLAKMAEVTRKAPEASSYINHQAWNPAGTRLLFFVINTTGSQRRSHVMVVDPNGDNLWQLDPSQFLNVSHYNWISDTEFLLTATTRDYGFGYFLIKDKSEPSEWIRLQSPTSDGHPTLMPNDPSCILTDSYPDRFGMQSLFFFHRYHGQQQTLARFYSPPSFVADRKCDLHPRVSQTGQSICVDTCHTGKRSVIVFSKLNR